MQPRLGQGPPSRSGSTMATLSPASLVATVTPIPALPPPRIATSKLRVMAASLPRLACLPTTAGPALVSGHPDRACHRSLFIYQLFDQTKLLLGGPYGYTDVMGFKEK